jgi:outer membrane lipoprotein SlyB
MQGILQNSLRAGRAHVIVVLLALAGCAQQPSYQVISQPVARTGTVDSVREVYEQKPNDGLGLIAGGLIGGGLGSLVGAGGGRTAATIVGALGG